MPIRPSAGLLRHLLWATPTGHLIVVWALSIALLVFGPIRYADMPSLTTWLYVAGCIAAFAFGGIVEWRMRGRSQHGSGTRVAALRLEKVIRATALIGLGGAVLIAIDKIFLSGLDFSEGVTAVRFLREQAVSSGTATALPRSPLLYAGYVTFAFSVAAYVLYLLTDTPLTASTRILAVTGLASPFLYSFVYGGRSPLFLVIGMACAAVLVRILTRSSPFASTAAALSLLGLIVVSVVYGSWILAERFAATDTTSIEQLQQRFETTYGATVTSLPPALSNDKAMHVVMDTYYFSHELPMLERTLNAKVAVGPYLGAYQLYLLAAFGERVVPSWNIDSVMIPQLKAANVYGWFSTAWGGMYLDFGLFGALVAVAICGWLAAMVYRAGLSTADDGARMLMCYVIAGIIASPILSIFTISISLPILVSMIITSALLRVSWRVPAPLAQPHSA